MKPSCSVQRALVKELNILYVQRRLSVKISDTDSLVLAVGGLRRLLIFI